MRLRSMLAARKPDENQIIQRSVLNPSPLSNERTAEWSAAIPQHDPALGRADGSVGASTTPAVFGHNFSTISVFPDDTTNADLARQLNVYAPLDHSALHDSDAAAPAPIVQARLHMNPPDDQYEREAEEIANLLTRSPNFNAIPADGMDQGIAPPTLRVQASPLSGNAGLADIPPTLEAEIATLPYSGMPLSAAERSFFEPRFGHDFSNVRIHTDAQASHLAQELNAEAFTVGPDIAFAAGAYAPGTTEGQHLIAHELTHVVQQTTGGVGQQVAASPAVQRQEAEPTAEPVPTPSPEATATPQPGQGGPGPVGEGVGYVSVHVGTTMTAEAALRELYQQGARQISQQALNMVASGTSVEEAARWATEARNQLKVDIRMQGSPITRGLAEARNMRVYGRPEGPTYDELIRQGRTPEEIIGSAGRSNTRVNRVATQLRIAGRFLIVVDLAIVTWEVVEAPEDERLQTAVEGVGGLAGAAAGGWAGAKAGGAVGAFFGPVGMAVGGVIGGIGGALLGGWAGSEAAGAAYEFAEELFTPDLDAQMSEIDAAEEQYIREQAQALGVGR